MKSHGAIERNRTLVLVLAALGLISAWAFLTSAQVPATKPDLATAAKASLAQLSGTMLVRGLSEPVEVIRDTWGVPHIFAKNTEDLFFAQGFVVAQDRMWQLEMWRRNGEGKLSEVLGPSYVTRDKFARLLAFRGNWNEEFKKYHPEGQKIFDSFARGINAAIQSALQQNKVPVEFELSGFKPEPVWNAKTVLTRMPGWTLSRNASSEVTRALQIKELGIDKVQELNPTNPEKKIEVPPGLNLAEISSAILDVTRGANDLRTSVKPDLGSNNWVVDGSKTTTGMPIIANDPHREVVNPVLRYVVHLVAPGWNALGATEPGLPGISIGHNERVAWGFTILGMDQQDLYIEETDPNNPNRYLYKGEWLDMQVEQQMIYIKAQQPRRVEFKLTRHGPVLYEDPKMHRAYALKWVGAELGGAGYIGSLNVLQAKSWTEFNQGIAKSWYIPSHSLVYADVEGNIGYRGVALTPIRKGWDGLLPVPGKDGKYEWEGYVPFDKLPLSFNPSSHYYASANNDVVPKILPTYNIPLGFEYTLPYRYNRIAEVLSANRKFSVMDMQKLQEDPTSLPARELVPLLRGLKTEDAEVKQAMDKLLSWDFVVDRESSTATIYEYWLMRLTPNAYLPHIPESARSTYRSYNTARVIQWMKAPDAAYGKDKQSQIAARDQILLTSLKEAIALLKPKMGNNMEQWKWGDIHTADFVHPLAYDAKTQELFKINPVRRSGDGFTVLATSSPSESNTKQTSGASFKFVFDVKDWDQSTGLSVPGNSAQPGSPHYSDLAPYWGEGKGFPLLFSRKKIEENSKNRLLLQPLRDSSDNRGAPFQPVQPEIFAAGGALTNAWADFDGDGDLDLFVGFRKGGISRLYRNDNGKFTDVASQVGIADVGEIRAAAWGDYDSDGNLDLYVGFARGTPTPNKLYRNDGNGKHFTDVAIPLGVNLVGTTRQVSWIDYDNDGDVDLFIAFRDLPNVLFRNDGAGKFTDVSKAMGVDDPRKTVGAIWFDFDEDGDLDLFVANQDGDLNGFYRNDGTRFVDIAHSLGVDGAPRPSTYGSVGPCLADFNNDGHLDFFVANYGPSALYRNDGKGGFMDVATELGLATDRHFVSCSWGDYDNDGRPDLYVSAFLSNIVNYRDYLFHNENGKFTDATPAVLLKHDADHGVQWADFDGDGAIDLSLASEHEWGNHFLFRNALSSDRAARSLQVMVLDERGHYTRPGSEVRVYTAGARKLLGTGIVDTGGGYCSQNAMPVHFGLSADGPVDVEVTTLTRSGRKVARVANIDPRSFAKRWLVIKVDANGQVVGESTSRKP